MRETAPFSTQQMSQIRYFADTSEVNQWLDAFIEVHDQQGDQPYYLHIDQVQVLPFPKNGMYPILAIYHRVYLRRGE